jgi:hypothetical protein
MLRASDGRWNQDVSLFARVNAGDPDAIIGRVVDVVTPNRIIRLQIDRRQYVEVEIDRVVEIADGIYEFFIDRKFFGDIAPGDRIRYQDTFDATILSTTSKVTVQQKGKRFKLGDLYEIKNGDGAGSILKVSGINDTGGINSIEFVKYGINYSGDFTATILPLGGQSATSAGSTAYLTNGTTGQVLTATTGGAPTWTTINALPSQTGNAGKFLTTDGSNASWAASGASAEGVIWENTTTITTNYTLATSKNGFSVGPITINSGVAVTVPSGQRWVIF